MEKMKTYKQGLFTPWGTVVCYEHVGRDGIPRAFTEGEWLDVTAPKPLGKENAVTFCDCCHADIQVGEKVANEHNLVKMIREGCGVDAYLAQTGGLNSACAIAVPGAESEEYDPGVPDEMLLTFDPYGTGHYVLGAYADGSPADVEYAEMEFESLDDLLAWVDAHPELVSHLSDASREADIGAVVEEAKARAADRNGHRAEKASGPSRER